MDTVINGMRIAFLALLVLLLLFLGRAAAGEAVPTACEYCAISARR